jgi:hypothetical protein
MLHSAFAAIFFRLVSPKNFSLGVEIWNSQRSDKQQRDLLIAAVRGTLRPTRNIAKGITWAVKRAETVAELRNDAVHAVFGIDASTKPHFLVVNPFATPPSRAARIEKEFRWTKTLSTARGDLLQLCEYAWSLYIYLGPLPGMTPTLPRRPRLRFVRAKDRADALYPRTLL